MIPLVQLEADLLRRGVDPDFVMAKAAPEDGVPGIVTRTEFLALQLRYGYQRAVALVQARINLAELERELQATSQSAAAMETALQASRTADLGAAFRAPAESTTQAAYMRGAREGTTALRTIGIRIGFDSMNPHAAVYARTQSSRLITHINDSQREAVRNLIETSVAGGRTVQEVARDIRNVVGLRGDQVRALLAYRERLTVRGGLKVDQLEKKVRRYADALLRQRGELIARTEVLSAANAGQLELWQEARRDGTLDTTWGKQWVTTPDELLCDDCESLDGLVVGFNDLFVSPDNTRVSALHAPLHPNCRCTLTLAKLS